MKEERALKIIKKDTLKSEEEFLNEIEMLKSIDHPNVLKLFEVYRDEFNYYIVTEYCSGGDLINYILKEKGISES